MSEEAYPAGRLWRDWQADVDAFVREGLAPRAGWRGRLQRLSALAMPPVVCCLLYRVSHYLYAHRWRRLAATVAWCNHVAVGASISPASQLGPGMYIPHPTAVVIEAVAGRGLRVYAGASLYARPWGVLQARPLSAAPSLGDGVVIGAKAAVVGPVHLGDRVVVSFNAVVEASVESGAAVLQSPLRNYQLVSATPAAS